MKTQVALQLYTVRDALEKDFVGTLRQVSKMGYAGIEYGGTGGMSVGDFKKLLKDLNLIPMSAGAGLKALQDEKSRNEFLARCGELETKMFMIGYEKRDSAASWKEFGGQLTEVGKIVKAAGVTLQYHNHAHEFEKYDGKTAHEIIGEAADPDCVKFQLDVGWVQRAGEDPVAWMKKLGKRIRTIHVKDTTAGDDPQWTEVGTGVLPLAAVHAAAQELGIDWYIVEQDTWARPSVEAAAISCENLRKILEK